MSNDPWNKPNDYWKQENMVAHPPHYNSGKIEVIEFIFDQGFGPEFCKGNALKYISRAGKKAGVDEIQDLEKAAWYVNYLVERMKATKENREPKRPNEMVSK